MIADFFKRVPASPTSPTRPDAPDAPRPFDVADLYNGPAAGAPAPAGDAASLPLDEKLRQAYFWMVNTAVISPFHDIEYDDIGRPAQTFKLGDRGDTLRLPSGQSYSSFVLLPLLTFATRRKCLLVGGPGRGKTSSATLIGVIAGYPIREVRRAIQKGQPQMTVADLLGTPLPADLVSASSLADIRIAWRSWLGMRVKIIDEYNRIPTRTQSALLTLMSDNYAEVFDQVYECPEAAWFLTANDDAGGGTYQVIEALRDRIDVVVKALHFNTRYLGDLLRRMDEGVRPEEVVPPQVIFSETESDALHRQVRAVTIPQAIRRRLEFFAAQFEYCEPAGVQGEYKTKDTARLAGVDWHEVTAAETGRDRLKDLGAQTTNGLSVRALMTAIEFVKAIAFFRGEREVALADVRQVLPFVLHDKLQPDPDAPFFATEGGRAMRLDKVSWLRQLFDAACAEYDRLDLDRDDPVGDLGKQFDAGVDGLAAKEVRRRLAAIEKHIRVIAEGRKFYGHLFDDVLALKSIHQRYTNYLRWLEWQQ